MSAKARRAAWKAWHDVLVANRQQSRFESRNGYWNPAVVQAGRMPNTQRKLWREGPWSREADSLRWTYKGLRCEIMRNSEMGMLCGYVGVPPGHPWYGQRFDAIEADAHGGLTFAEPDHDGTWWVGFDCAHWLDGMPLVLARVGGTYRSIHYVMAEVRDLADQAKEALH